jgi:arylformamidase
MKHFTSVLLVVAACASEVYAQQVTRDIPYATEHERAGARCVSACWGEEPAGRLWIHGGGWQSGDKSPVALKPKAFMDAGFVFVSINHRLLRRPSR